MFCILILRLASPLRIPGKSRMRKRARTDLCGGAQRWSSLPRQLSTGQISVSGLPTIQNSSRPIGLALDY
jgi:hypothetical protein